jgi:hypothetical protein
VLIDVCCNLVDIKTCYERLLVEWNTVIMEEWAPVAWAKTLSNLDRANLLRRGWSAWPAEEHDPDSYWFRLAREVTKQIVGCGAELFPSYDLQHLVSIHDKSVLIAPRTHDNHSLFSILALFGVYVVQPPPHIFSVLEMIANNSRTSTLSPRSLHNLLCDSLTNITGPSFEVKAAHQVMEYLALTSSPPTLELLSDLPWFSRTDGSLVSLTSPSASTQWIIPETEEEAWLFADDPHMLAWNCVSDDLRVHLLKASAAEVLNVTPLHVALVSTFLASRFSHLDSSTDELPEAYVTHHFDWLVRFWTWIAQWPARENFFKTQAGRVQHLHLLPTSRKSLRKMSSQVVIFRNVSQVVVKAWGALGVHGLHDSIPRDAVSIFKEKHFALEQGTPGFVALLIKSCIMDRQPLLDQHSFKHIRDSLTSGLRLEAEPEFSVEDQNKLLQLPVFMVRLLPGNNSILGPASGKRIFISLPDNYPLPRLLNDQIVYVDMGDFSTANLIKLVDRNRLEICSELDILRLAIEHWDSQPTDLQDRFISNIFDNRRHTFELRERLKTLNFVSVNQIDHRVPPRGLIHPHSSLAVLYKGEAGKIPTGLLASRRYLLVMENESFVKSSLDESIVQERLEYLSSGAPDEKANVNKAAALVKLLNQSWRSSYGPHISRRRSMKWFPCNGLSLVDPDHCRDSHPGPHAHPYYYNFCLNILDGIVVSELGFRSALGWSDPIPSPVLIEQLRKTLNTSDRKRDRLVELLNYLGRLRSEGRLTREVEHLKQIVEGQLWIPVMRSIGSHNMATSKHAVLLESGLRPPFRQVDPQLRYPHFLLEMGCTQRYRPIKRWHKYDAILILCDIDPHLKPLSRS